MLVSSVPNFRPDTDWRRWSLAQVASSVALRGGAGAAFPVYAAQAPGCSIWSVPCAARASSPQVFHKSLDSTAPAFCTFPGPSSSGSQEFDGHTLPGCGAPSPVPGPGLSFRPRQMGAWPSPLRVPSSSTRLCRSGACALCLAATLPVDVNHPVPGSSPGRIQGNPQDERRRRERDT